MKISQVLKITIAALLLVLTIIFTRITPLQNFPLIPWIRISLGPALIIFSSILLGPLYGALVGAGSDILGIILVPNALGYGINPLFTLVYGLLGVLPWILYQIIKFIKNQNLLFFILIGASTLVFIALASFIFFVPQIKSNYNFELWQKILIVTLSFTLMVSTIISVYFINRYYFKRHGGLFSPYKIGFVCLISEFVLMLFLNTLVKTITFEVNYWVIFFSQLVVFFVDIPLNTFVVSGILYLFAKYRGVVA